MRWLAWAAMACAFAAIYAAMVQGTIPLTFLYTSDTLRIHSMLRDIHEGASLLNWDLPANPYIFPDLALYLPISYVVADVPWRVVIFALVQLATFVGGCLWLNRGVARPVGDMVAFVSAQTLLMFAVVMGFTASGKHALLNNALVNDYHFGVIVAMPWVLGLLLRGLEAPARRAWGYVAALCAASFLVALSDTLYFVQVVAPALGGLTVCAIVTRAWSWRRVIGIALALAVFSPAGYAVNATFMEPRTEIYVQTRLQSQSLANLIAWMEETVRLDPALVLIWIAAVGVSAVGAWIALAQAHRDPRGATQPARVLFATTFTLLTTGATLVSVVIAGNFTDGSTGRYILASAFAPLLIGWPAASVLLAANGATDRPRRKGLAAGATSLALAGVIVWLLIRIPYPALAVAPTYEEVKARCLDEEAHRRGLRNGVVTFWQGLYTTAVSRHDIRFLQVDPELSIHFWNNNLDWYETEMDFAVSDPQMTPGFFIREGELLRRFGEPAETFTCGTANVFVYNRDADVLFRRYFRSQPIITRVRAGHDSFTFPGYAMPSWVGGLPIGASKAASDDWENIAGILAAVPIRNLPKGDYAFEIHLFAENTDSASWDVARYERDPLLGSALPNVSGEIAERGRQVVSGTFHNSERANVAVRVWYAGHGTVFVDKIRFRRLDTSEAREAGEASAPLFDGDGPPAWLGEATNEPTLQLLEPRPETFHPNAWIDFAWQWTGPPPAQGQAFEVRLWQESDPYPFGAHDADADRVRVRQVGDLYMLRLDMNGAYSVQTHGGGDYLWTVALVEVEPAYREIASFAPPQRIYIVR